MRFGVAFTAVLALWGPPACKQRAQERGAPGDLARDARSGQSSSPTALDAQPSPKPLSSAARGMARDIQATKLQLVPERLRRPRLAFGNGVVGQLGERELLVRSASDFEVVLRRPIEGPRALLRLSDGALLAAGAGSLLRYRPENKRVDFFARPVLLPGAALFADAVRPDRLWVFDGGGTGAASSPPTLSSLELDPKAQGILLPSQQLVLARGGSGVFGTTREGVWIHWGEREAQRFGPGGARLPPLILPALPDLLWALPSRRLDQCYLVDAAGHLFKAVVSPSFRRLSGVQLAGQPIAADVGDDGRLIAVVVVVGAGPRFELHLFDPELNELARVPLPSEAPTGDDDWVRVVTENQGVAVAPREPRVAVGGPARLMIVDGHGQQLFSSASK